MAHFAEIDPNENNKILRVIVVSDSDCLDKKGQESEQVGASFCHENFGGTWIQTSYNKRVRVNFAEIDGHYDESHDCFVPPAPFSSWIFDFAKNTWEAPVPIPDNQPENTVYLWDEANLEWVLFELK